MKKNLASYLIGTTALLLNACVAAPAQDVVLGDDDDKAAGALWSVSVHTDALSAANPEDYQSIWFDLDPEAPEEVYTQQLEAWIAACPDPLRYSDEAAGRCKLTYFLYSWENNSDTPGGPDVPEYIEVGDVVAYQSKRLCPGGCDIEMYARGTYSPDEPQDGGDVNKGANQLKADDIYVALFGNDVWGVASRLHNDQNEPADYLLTKSAAGNLTLKTLDGKVIRRAPGLYYPPAQPGLKMDRARAELFIGVDKEVIVRGWYDASLRSVAIYDLMVSVNSVMDRGLATP